MLSFTFTIFLWVLIIVVAASFITGVVMFVVDVIRYAPARNKIQVMSSKLQSLMDSVSDVVSEDEVIVDDAAIQDEKESNVSLFRKRGDDDVVS